VLALLLGALAWGLLHPAPPAEPGVIGRPAPNLVVAPFDGGQVNLAELRGRPVVLNFWASWCVSCRQEQAALGRAAAATAGRVAFLGVNIQDSEAAARSFLAEQPPPYPSGLPVAGLPGYAVKSPPQTFFVDAGGRVIASHAGPLDDVTLDAYLRRMAT
jgi:cytochrome c biogenesis protein CcmG/thiol:disulfide interchange protein DsbE